mmetsp:Transcript_21408/g.34286  ORF Transcript_21408/g.34286 Transcript_21408/m.34286 type:complete len:128 (+) Transcript_21408:235-618(+)
MEQELNVQLEASRQDKKRLMIEEVLIVGYCEKWTQSWAEVRSRITDILVQGNEHHTSNAVFRAPLCVEFGVSDTRQSFIASFQVSSESFLERTRVFSKMISALLQMQTELSWIEAKHNLINRNCCPE